MNNLMLNNNTTMTSLEVVDLVNKLRLEEGNNKVKRHDNFIRDIDREVESLKNVGISTFLNFEESSYEREGRKYRCYILNKAGIMQMLNKESAYVRYKTQQYIEALENKVTNQSVNPLQAIEQTLTPLLDKFSDMQNQITNMQNQLNEMTPKSALHDFISYLNLFNYSTFYISRIASLYNLEAKEMNKLLNRVGLLNGYSGNWIPGSKVKERHLHIYQQKGKRVMKWTLEGAVLIYMELEKQLGLLPTKEVTKLG